jgi:very-short-patch-repair endonuclease
MRWYWHLLALLSLVASIFIALERPDLWPLALICGILAGIILFFLLLGMLGKYLRTLWRDRKIRYRDATTESPLERAIAQGLEKRNIRYKREHVISHTHVDFAFPEVKLAVECDGWRYHHTRKEHDARRDAFLKSQGWTVVRFSGEEIRKNPDACIEKIIAYL